MLWTLMVAAGFFWTLTYLFIIRRGFLDRSYGMPLVSLCVNISWEFIFAFLHPHEAIQRVVNIVWFSFDVVIFFQLLRYGPREFANLTRRVFYTMVALALVTSFCVVLLISYEFDDWIGAYSAFGSNLLMSVLFILMLYQRRSLRGQSMNIAVCKFIGTALASLAFFLYVDVFRESVLLPFLYVAILLYDAIYIGLLYRQQGLERVPVE